jgi:hypothetical protein
MIRDNAAEEDAVVPQAQVFSIPFIEQKLDALAKYIQNCPDYLVTRTGYPRIALSSPSVSGGKVWIGTATETGISIHWGKSGTQGSVKHIAISRCERNNPVLELKRRAIGKLQKSYSVMPSETFLP